MRGSFLSCGLREPIVTWSTPNTLQSTPIELLPKVVVWEVLNSTARKCSSSSFLAISIRIGTLDKHLSHTVLAIFQRDKELMESFATYRVG